MPTAVTAIPQVNYVTDSTGKPVFVQISVAEWAAFLEEYRRVSILLEFKRQLKNGLREVRQIQKGEKPATTLNEFLNEL